MTTQSLGALGMKSSLPRCARPSGSLRLAISLRSVPLLDFCESERVLSSGLRGGGLALEDVDDEGCFALGCPTLRTVGIGLDFKRGRCDGGFGLTHGWDLQVEGER